MLIFKYDLDTFDIDEVQKIHNYIAEVTKETVVSIPKTCELYRIEDNKKEFEYIFKGE